MTSSLKHKILLSITHDIEVRDFDKFQGLSKFVEDALDSQHRLIESEATILLKEAKDEEDVAGLMDYFADDLSLYRDKFPLIQRYALMVSLLSMAEANMTRLCLTYATIFSINDKFNIYKLGVINRGLKYLEHYICLQTTKLGKSISLIQNLVLIRNAIVHSQGSLKYRKDAHQIKEFIRHKKYLGIDRHDRIILKKGAIEHYSNEIHKFYKLLEINLSERFREFIDKDDLNKP